MTWGLKVVGDHGQVQIDENYTVVVVREVAGITGTPTVDDHFDYYSFTTTVADPIFAVYIPEASKYIGGIVKTSLSGSTWTYTVALKADPAGGADLSLVKRIVLGRPLEDSSGWGLNIYTDDGRVAYSSSWKPALIGNASGNKFAIIGGAIGGDTIIDVELLTFGLYQTTTRIITNAYRSTPTGVEQASYESVTVQNGAVGGASSNSSYNAGSEALNLNVVDYV
jgi:hypothetical protein